MATHTLSLAEYLRPWSSAGITHVLCDDELAAQLPIAEDIPEQPEVVERVERVISSAAPKPSPERRPPPVTPPASHSSTPPSRARQLPPKRPPQDRGRPDWPQQWQALFTRTHLAPILWTYEELGTDLCGTSSPERSQCLRTLIAALKLPKGSSTFWPPSIPAPASSPTPETESALSASAIAERTHFLRGIQKLRPRAIVHMGAIAFPDEMLADAYHAEDISGFQLRLPFTQTIVRGILYVKLPSIEQLARDPVLHDRSAVFLRTAFHGLSFL